MPDPMAGISWDDTIGTVLCDTTKIDWGEIGTHDLTYTIAAMDQTIEFETIKVTVYENLEFYIYGMEGEEKVAVGGSYDPMADISYDDKISSVTADTSELDLSKVGEYAVTYTLTDRDGREQTAVRRVHVTGSGADEANLAQIIDGKQAMTVFTAVCEEAEAACDIGISLMNDEYTDSTVMRERVLIPITTP